MMERTEAQRQASSKNARLATEGKRRRATERREQAEARRKQAEARLDELYRPVHAEILAALEAAVAGDRNAAATRERQALLAAAGAAAAAAAAGIYDSARHRTCLLALREGIRR
jgi:hypothetical protein